MRACSVMSHSATPWTVVRQAPLSMEFSRQEYLSGLPFPTQGDPPDPGIELRSPVSPAFADRFFTTVLPGKPLFLGSTLYIVRGGNIATIKILKW